MQFIKIIKTILIVASLMMISPSLGSDYYGSAYAQKKKKKKVRKGNKRVTTKRYRVKKKGSTKIDLDGVDLTGSTKVPLSNFISAAKPERGYDFIKLRTQWIIEMKQSASSLEKGVEGGSRK